jgi:DNA-binding MarR family transcriptional regulator
MRPHPDESRHVMRAAQQFGMASVLFRNAVGRALNLNVTDYECMSLLTMRGTCSPTELSRHTGLSTGATTAMLDRLEAAGYISRKPNPEDRRGTIIEPSSHYREMAAPLVAGIQKAHGELLVRYSAEELEIVARFLEEFTTNVTSQTQALGG